MSSPITSSSSSRTSPQPASDARYQLVLDWLASLAPELGVQPESLRPASVDASFRRYFRADTAHGSVIVMDAPPQQEDSRAFVAVAAMLRTAGVNAPAVLADDLEHGLLLLTDLGATTYLDALNDDNAPRLFDDATDTLIRWQLATRPAALPAYDEAMLRRELALFPDWYVARHLQHTLDARQTKLLAEMFDRIVAANLAQPVVFVHRDFMPRNLMVSAPNPGVLDFQDAVIGPISYDVASLFRDAFISWDEARVTDWTMGYWGKARAAGLPVAAHFGEFWRDVEWMGLQRHLKVLGIFARINYRDGKPHYLADTPRFTAYVRHTVRRYDELAPLAQLFDELEAVAERHGYAF